MPVVPDAGEFESFVVLTVADDTRVQVGMPTRLSTRPSFHSEESSPPARPVRRGTGIGIAPDLGVGTPDEAVGAAPEAVDRRPTAGRPMVDDASPKPPRIATATEGVAQLVGWVPLRTPLRWEQLTDGVEPDELWGVNVDGVSPQ
jgi:hypothetical protein